MKAVLYVKEKGRITNKEYQKINDVSKKTQAINCPGWLTKSSGSRFSFLPILPRAIKFFSEVVYLVRK